MNDSRFSRKRLADFRANDKIEMDFHIYSALLRAESAALQNFVLTNILIQNMYVHIMYVGA